MAFIKDTIFINPGHSLYRVGSSWKNFKENLLNIEIRNKLVPLLEAQGFKVEQVPDDLNLRRSIAWINERSKNIGDGLVLALHLNSSPWPGIISGAESFYVAGSIQSENIARILLDKYCEESGMKNRGARPDSQSRATSLGILRKTNPWAVLIELGYINSASDMLKIKDTEMIARAVAIGVCEIYEVQYIETEEKKLSLLQIQINALKLLLDALMAQIKGLLLINKLK